MATLSKELDETSVRSHNVEAITEVTDVVRSTLGPMGMDKMLIDANGNVVVTNDGVTVLQEMAIEDPIANMVLKVANQQVKKRSDGTTTVAVLTGRLLTAALSILDDGIHASTIAEGFDLANREAKRKMVDMAIPIDVSDSAVATQVARTALNGRVTGSISERHLASLAVDAVQGVTRDDSVNLDAIRIDKTVGDTGLATRVHDGALVTEDPAYPAMPTDIADANVLTVDGALEPASSKGVADAKRRISAADRFERFDAESVARAAESADRVRRLGTDAIFHIHASDDELVRQLAERDVLVVNVSGPKLRFLKKVLGSRMVPDLERTMTEHFGHGDVRYDTEEEWLHVTGEDRPGVTVSVRGTVEPLIDELHRSITDATDAIGTAVEDGHVLPGGGATEAALATHLRSRAKEVPDERQLVIDEFANALEEIPRQLARSAGMDEIDALTALRKEHTAGNEFEGIDPDGRTVTDMRERGVVDTVSAKATALDLATETSTAITRIDGMIPTSKSQVRTAPGDEG